MKYSPLFIFTAFILCCCSSNSNNCFPFQIKTSNAVLVKPEIFKTDKIHAEIYDIRILDSVLVLRSDDGRGCVQLFNKYNFKYLATKGIKGRGPGEILNDMIEIKTINDSLHMFQLSKNSISIFDKNKFLIDSLPIADKTITFEKYKGNFDIFPINDYYVSRPTIKTRFALYNSSGQYIDEYLQYPNLGTNIDQETHDIAFRFFSLTEPKPDLSKFVSLTFLGATLEIFNVKNGVINKLVEKKYLDPNLKNSKDLTKIVTEETNMGFYGVYVTNNFIYASYSGLKEKDYRKNNILLDYITVFDWNGDIKKIYKVEGGLLDLAVDEVLNKIYIVTKSADGDEVVGFFNIK